MNTGKAAFAYFFLAAVIAGAFFYFGEYNEYQIAHFGGRVLGIALVATFFIWVTRTKLLKSVSLSLAILAGVLIASFQEFDELRTGFEIRQAKELITSSAAAQNIAEIAAKHPSNRVLAISDVTWTRGMATRTKITQLFTEANTFPNQISQPIYTVPSDQLPAVIDAYRNAIQKLQSSEETASVIIDEELADTSAAILKITSGPFGTSAIKGLKSRLERDKDLYARLFEANRAVFSDVVVQGEYLQKTGGKFDPAQNAVVFQSTLAAKGWDALVAKAQVDAKTLQAVTDEGMRIDQQQTQAFDKGIIN